MLKDSQPSSKFCLSSIDASGGVCEMHRYSSMYRTHVLRRVQSYPNKLWDGDEQQWYPRSCRPTLLCDPLRRCIPLLADSWSQRLQPIDDMRIPPTDRLHTQPNSSFQPSFFLRSTFPLRSTISDRISSSDQFAHYHRVSLSDRVCCSDQNFKYSAHSHNSIPHNTFFHVRNTCNDTTFEKKGISQPFYALISRTSVPRRAGQGYHGEQVCCRMMVYEVHDRLGLLRLL